MQVDEPTQFANMNGPELLRWYNTGVAAAVAAGYTGFRQVKVFHDRTAAIKRCAALESSRKAWEEGLQAQENQKETIEATDVGDAPSNNTGLHGHENPVSPGRARLQADPENAEQIRQEVLADQEKAAEDWGPTQEKIVAKKEKKVKKVKSNGGNGRSASFKDDQKITVLAEGNPKREGSRGHEVFDFYKTGMLVSTFVEKVGSRGEALANLRYDTGKEFVKVS